MRAPTTRPARRHAPRLALAACLTVLALAVSACSDDGDTTTRGTAGPQVLLQPVAAAGPDPFTPSSATAVAPLPSRPQGGSAADKGAAGTTALRTVSGSVPGLYGGTRQLGSCDVEQQASYLAADEDKARAFAGAAGVAPAELGDFLRDLTPVVLRADTRVTSHGFRSGRANAFQSVLQAGTAVLVDGHGLPRVRCACGNPLLPPAADRGAPVHQGPAWPGFEPGQVVVVRPTTQLIENLVIVNVTDNTWIERKTGDDGAQDAPPRVPPSHDPSGPLLSDSPVTPSADPCATATASGTPIPPLSATPSTGRPGTAPPTPPSPSADCPTASPSDSSSAQDPGQRPQPPPGTGSRTPAQPPTDLPPDLPTDLPTELLPGDPLTGESEIPFGPGDGYDPYAPYGPADPYQPADPYGVPQDLATDPGQYLESA
ncbi:DUF6777 domain-containing protein [Streptomyces sp. NPDC089919]|uniref:DUF6777 domain-containing protein n=1 Tax=Streptomyces sp. NPDC089919 TaxID=3155188 RepID=UPI00341B59FE